MHPSLPRHDYPDAEALAAALADAVATGLRSGIDARGAASLALSGGRTPARFFAALSQVELDWARVSVTLVDERWVPADHERSNEGFLRRGLLQNKAAAASVIGLVNEAPTPEEGAPAIAARIAALPLPFDAVVLGMGGDGHTASFFPGGDRLAEALDPETGALVLPMRADGAGEPRITLTLPVVAAARAVYLHIEGAEKAVVLETALGSGPAEDLPVRAVLRHPAAAPEVFWCP